MVKRTKSKKKTKKASNSNSSTIGLKYNFKTRLNKNYSKCKNIDNSLKSSKLEKKLNDNNNNYIIDKLEKILSNKNYSNEYKKRLIHLFQDFLNFIFEDKKTQKK